MKLLQPRLRVRSLMIAVAILAVALGVEIETFHWSRNLVSENGNGVDYIRREAWFVWAIMQIPLTNAFILIGLMRIGVVRLSRSLHRHLRSR